MSPFKTYFRALVKELLLQKIELPLYQAFIFEEYEWV